MKIIANQTITSLEKFEIKQQIDNKGCFNCTNPSCRVPSIEKVGLDKDGNIQGNSCLGWNNDELIIKQKVLKKTSNLK